MHYGMGCTVTAIYDSKQNRYYLGSNSDNPWDARTKVCVRDGDLYRFIGTELVCKDESLPWSNMITRGVNDQGIAYTFAYVDCSNELKDSSRVKFKGFGEHILGNFASLEEVHQYLQGENSLPHGNFLFVDSKGNALICELHPEEQIYEWNPKNPLVKTNHYLTLDYVEKDFVSTTNSQFRYQNGMEAINNTHFGASIIVGLKEFLSNHRNDKRNKYWGSSTCNHGSIVGTVSSEIIDAKNKILWYCFGPPCGATDKLAGWGEYIPFSLDNLPDEVELTTTEGSMANLEDMGDPDTSKHMRGE